MFRSSTAQPVIDDLLAIPSLAGCPRRELEVLARATTSITVSPGKVLCKEGTHPMEAFLVVDGEVDVLVAGRWVACVGAGEFVGEMALVDPADRSATVVARTVTTVLTMNPTEFATVIADAPTVARVMLAEMARRLRDADRRLPAVSA